jgi:hypothetical protein
MSWWVSITDPETDQYMVVEPFTEGGTYVLGGSYDADLNITYNYSSHYYRVLGLEDGLRGLDGKDVAFALPILEKGVEALEEDYADDYWEPTEGNARRALVTLVQWCKQAVDAGKDPALLRVS